MSNHPRSLRRQTWDAIAALLGAIGSLFFSILAIYLAVTDHWSEATFFLVLAMWVEK